MNFAGQVPEWSDSEVPALAGTCDLPVLPVAGTGPAIFPPLFFAPSLLGTMKHNWSAWCQYNVTGWVSMWAYDMLSQ